MFVLKSLGKFILGNPEQTDLLQLHDGEFWQVEQQNSIVDRTRTNAKASLTLKRKSKPFEYQLVVEEEDSSLGYDLKVEMDFVRKASKDGRSLFSWKSADKEDVSYEFVNEKNAIPTTLEMFHVTVGQCLYESRERKSHTTAGDKELQALIKSTDKVAVKVEADPLVEGEVMFKTETAGFYVFDSATNLFVPRCAQAIGLITRKQGAKAAYNSHLAVVDDETGSIAHQQLIDPDATLHTDRASNSFIWCFFSATGYVYTFSLRFPDPASLMAFSNAMGQAIYECLNQEKFSKLAQEDADYIMNPFTEDVEMKDAETAESDSDVSEEAEEEDQMEEASSPQGDQGGESNSQLAIGFKNDRSFVSRGHSIGVFKTTTDERLKFHASIDKIQTLKGKTFTPKKMMLHEEDSALVLMNPDDQHKLYKMDLEYGKVVEEWTVHPDAPVTNIVPDSKYAQMTPGQTMIGMNANSIFRIDPRLPGDKRVDSEMKQYVVKNKFSCGATTGKGELAVASEKGEVRLFNRLDKRAKTLLPGFGDPIIGVDVTESGRYLIATCKSYLLLICTEVPGEEVLGFTKSMGSEKPAPKRLQLKPEHVAFMGTSISFTPARFSTGQSEEKSIITSTGPYVITWNLRRVKQGKLYDYQIKKYADKVVADNFRFGQDRSIVVTLPHHVTMISKKSLSTPSPRAFLRTPHPKRSGDIVDSPY